MSQRQLSWRELRKRCDELFDGITVPDPFDLDEFAAAVGRLRGRAVRVVDLPDDVLLDGAGDGGRTVCGLLVQFATEDVVLVEPRDWVHRVHVALHEIAHLVCGHPGTPLSSSALRLFPDLDPSLVRSMLARTRYSEAQEREAEAVASLLSARLIGRGARAKDERGADAVMARVEHTLGGAAGC